MYLRKRLRVRHEGQRRNLFLRYVGEVATAVSRVNGTNRDKLYHQLLDVAKKRTAEADLELDDRGKAIEDAEDFGENVIIVPPEEATIASV
jgi:DNA topoisomerase VI subunit B